MKMQNSEKMYLNWLYHVPGIGRKRMGSMLEGGMSPCRIYGTNDEELEKYLREAYRSGGIAEGYAVADKNRIMKARKDMSPQKLYEDLIKKKIQFLFIEDKEYPARLREIPDAPIALYRMGKEKADVREAGGVEVPPRPVVAVVGTRNCSEYGRIMAKRIGEVCGEMRVGLVSGLASGIDGIAQWWALNSGGDVTAVLGCGVDVCYPWENKAIYMALLERGEIYSEYIPGTQPKSGHFPPRNRIISGLCDAVIVVEAREKSGTLITVDMALEQGKDVYVVPGRITDPMSLGCNQLIAQGAGVITSLEKTMVEIASGMNGSLPKRKASVNEKEEPVCSNIGLPEQRILQILDCAPMTVQQLYDRLSEDGHCELGQLQQKLLRLEMEGMVLEKGGSFVRKHN